jgi:putative restriction endonuclease
VWQVCAELIGIASGANAEGAHIRPLGRPHDGSDVESNVLLVPLPERSRALRVRSDREDDLTIIDPTNGGTLRKLRTVTRHSVDSKQLAYHRENFDLGA